MKVKYRPIRELRKDYKVIACFKDDVNIGKTRVFADVVRNNYYERAIDAYIIMINPGSCKEKPGKLDSEIANSQYYAGQDIIEAVSDMAQKCIMLLMDTCNISKVRILNLSDKREGDLSKIMAYLKSEAALKNSIFSPERTDERALLMPDDAICIASWGLDPGLIALKEQAYRCIGKENIIGVLTDENTYSYKYIKPYKKDDQLQVIGEIADKYKEYCDIKSKTWADTNKLSDEELFDALSAKSPRLNSFEYDLYEQLSIEYDAEFGYFEEDDV